MPEAITPFRFLRDHEFARLDSDAKAAYLMNAVRELAKMTAVLSDAAAKPLADPKDE